jgi:hypothetical protein
MSSYRKGERSLKEGFVLSLFLMTCKTSSFGMLVNRLTVPKLTRQSSFCWLTFCITFMKCSDFLMKESVLPAGGRKFDRV